MPYSDRVDARDGDEATGVYKGPPLIRESAPIPARTTAPIAVRDTTPMDAPEPRATGLYGRTAIDSIIPIDTQVTSLELMDIGPGTTLGEFRIEAKIGEGGMGTVFSAVHPMIAKRAAIKILKHQLCRDVSIIERFIDEARVVNQIGHPNIVDIFAFGEMPDGRRYLAMEWLRGETLRERLKRGPMSLTQMAHVIRPLARALEAAHDQQVIHRDLKPENVFLVEVPHDEPHVKLLDFGIAKLAGEKAEPGEPKLLGTPMYISPEQARNAHDAGPMSDVYSLGAMAFELLTGRPPFQRKGPIAMVTAHLEETPVAPSSIVPEIPDELDRLVLEMLAKTPAERPSLSHIRSVLDLVRDPAELVVRPHVITPRLRAEESVLAELIAREAEAPSRTTPMPEQVGVRFAKRADPTPIPVNPPQDAIAAAPVAAARGSSRWVIVVAILLFVALVATIVSFTL